ncbi:MAG: MFS transporter [Chloroflexi bacterium]|nr:MFS transporter [Chloroflexota bacterium]
MQTTTKTGKRSRVFYGWYIVGASVALNFYLSLAFFNGFQVFFLPILREFKWTRALTSGAFSLRQVETGLLAPAIGFLVDRWGPRPVILLGVAFSGLGMILMGFINSVWTFYLAFLIISLGMSGASHGVSWVTAVGNWFSRARGRALGIAMLGPVISGPLLVTIAIMEEAIGWRISVVVLGIGMWVVGFPLAMVARSRPEDYGYLPDGATPDELDSENTRGKGQSRNENSWGLTARQALATREFWVMTILFGAQFVGIGGLMVHLIPLLEGIGYSSTQAASILGMVFFLSGIGRLGAGMFADRLDQRAVLIGLIGFQAIGIMVLSQIGASGFWQSASFALPFGIGFGGTIPLRPFLIRRFFGARAFGSIQGLMQGIAIAAGVVSPVFYGYVFDVSGSYNVALYVSVAIVASVIPLTFLLAPSRKAEIPAG